jgi:hypothetical protein
MAKGCEGARLLSKCRAGKKICGIALQRLFQQHYSSHPFVRDEGFLTGHSSGVSGSERSKSEHSHPPTFIKRPAKLRYLRTSGSSASPAASDISPAHRPAPRPYPYLSLFQACSFSASLWYFLAVVCGCQVLPLRWQAFFRGVRGKRLTPCCVPLSPQWGLSHVV